MSALSAAEMFGRVAGAGMGQPLRIRTERCACKGEIVANVDDPGPDVARHNATIQHRAWWARVRRDWQGEDVTDA